MEKTVEDLEVNENLNSALVNAAANGDLELVKSLIEKGADVTVDDNEAVANAAENGHLEVVKLLIEAGAEFPTKDNYIGEIKAGADVTTEDIEEIEKIEEGAGVTAESNNAVELASDGDHLE